MIGRAHEHGVLTKNLRVPPGRADAIPIEKAKWDRIKRRVRKLDQRGSTHWLSSAASAFAGIAVSSLLAAIAIPTGKHSEIEPWVQPGLFAVVGVSALLAVASFWFFLIERRTRQQERADILDEMETEEDAWRG